MIQHYVDRFMAAEAAIKKELASQNYWSYGSLVEMLIKHLHDDDYHRSVDPERITVIDHGHYQGTLVYIIGCTGYQPSTYYSIKVSYGSCSGCDTICGINEDDDRDRAINDYFTLMLHMVQEMKEL